MAPDQKKSPYDSKPRKQKNVTRKASLRLTPRKRPHIPNTGQANTYPGLRKLSDKLGVAPYRIPKSSFVKRCKFEHIWELWYSSLVVTTMAPRVKFMGQVWLPISTQNIKYSSKMIYERLHICLDWCAICEAWSHGVWTHIFTNNVYSFTHACDSKHK